MPCVFQILRMTPWVLMRNGVAGFNGVLVGTVFSVLFPAVYSVERSPKLWAFIAGGALTT